MVGLNFDLNVSFSNHKEFHIFWLAKHSNLWNRRLHVIGTVASAVVALSLILTGDLRTLILVPIVALLPGWIGDSVLDKITPTTFKYPYYSFLSHLTHTKNVVVGKESF